ncbi:glutamine synthetase III [candidate division KSB1 bacterium]|nr:glutamine synthetase III [candidate division KSB1 bacterium]MBL7094471.1 glutamine synthetase III [candidate division KSB1 bacterium]
MSIFSTGSSLRQEVLLKIAANGKIPYESPQNNSTSYFGINTFNDKVMRERLPKDAYKKLRDTIKSGDKLDMSISNTVAHAMKEWAISKGASHFTHWFQPQTGLTAEKHDAFLELDEGEVIERFKGNQLVQGEPDASSFPSGGSRTTFEARGYTMWDPSSPAFIVEGPKGGILCIPSVFISYTGEVLDKKTPLLRSMDVLSNSALKVLRLFGNDSATRVIATIGTEQEYFLIDKAFYLLRPDLQHTGRTLQGAQPPKGQQLDDHYFGSIKERVLAFMQDTESELYKLGVPAKTRHNEVAPHQFEIVPIFAEANVGADRNQLIMEVLKKTANRHGMALLLHEKPFAGINGSGKHNNWSMSDPDGNNLLDPGDTPEKNLQFLIFLVAVLRAVHKYGGLLRMTIASAGNDHRLGANEAPPAIISVFLGEQLSTILDDIKEGRKTKKAKENIIDLGLSKIPSIFRDYTDRNRTSPFAFTGEKFEFRAIGSSASVSLANTVLSTAVAESIDLLVEEIEKAISNGDKLDTAILKILQKSIIETEPIRFEGNNYSKEWEEEAERRGLLNIKKTGYALDLLMDEKNVNLLLSKGIFKTRAEIENRYHTKLEQYITALEIEVQTFCDLIDTRIIPAAIAYQNQLLSAVKGLMEIKDLVPAEALKEESKLLHSVIEKIISLKKGNKEIVLKSKEAEEIEDLSIKAKFFSDNITKLLNEVRTPADELEKLVPDVLWPLPKYSEMLFVL